MKNNFLKHFNIIDVFVLVLIIGVALGTAYKFTSPAASVSGGQKTINYRVMIKDVRDFSGKYYEEGQEAFDSKTGTSIGVIKKVEILPYEDVLDMADGSVISAEVPGKIKIYLDLEATGLETDQSFLIGGTYELKTGAGIFIMTKYVDVTGVVDSIESN